MERQLPLRVPDVSVSEGIPLSLVSRWGDREDVLVSLRLNHDSRYLHVRFAVKEPQLRRMCTHHNDAVYTDSCVEAFLQAEGEDSYVNFEFSAAGYMLAGKGTGRKDRTLFPPELLETVPLRVTVSENSNEGSFWHLEASLDLALFGLVPEGKSLASLRLRGNFYKCGDGLHEPHYLSYGPIGTVEPDFHTPAFFVPIQLV
jgi:hypothetical protein